jgi:hypothetical protein
MLALNHFKNSELLSSHLFDDKSSHILEWNLYFNCNRGKFLGSGAAGMLSKKTWILAKSCAERIFSE